MRAGYDVLSKGTSQSVSWLQTAHEDLALVYDALGDADQARRFEGEFAEVKAQASAK